MTDGLKINGEEALKKYGAMMGDGFAKALLCPVPTKQGIENESRLEHGKRVIASTKLSSREVTLQFNIVGTSDADFAHKMGKFTAMLYGGDVTISAPSLGAITYHLIYKNATVFSLGLSKTACKMSVKFEEPNPSNR